MGILKARRERRVVAEALAPYDTEVNAAYEREHGLGVTAEDIQRFLGKSSVGKPKAHISRHLLFDTLRKNRTLLTEEQRLFVIQASFTAAETMALPDEQDSFFNGYSTYLGILEAKERSRGRLPYEREELAALTPDISQSSAIYRLAAYAMEQAPLVPETAQRLFTLTHKSESQNYKDLWHDRDKPVHELTLVAAGVGLACTHAFTRETVAHTENGVSATGPRQ